MDKFILGIDIGGTYVKTGIYSVEHNRIIEKNSVPTEKKLLNFKKLLINIANSYKNKYSFNKIGIGFPGNISPNGIIIFSPHIPDSVGFNIKKFFKEELNLKLKIDNDANLFALAHSKFSKERYKDLICLTLGTGIGGGAVLNKKIFTNSRGIGMEFGHICVVPNGALCSCGKKGCMEAYSSSSGMLKRYGKLELKEFIQLYKLYKNGDKKAEKIIKEGFYFLGVGTASLINVFAPEIVYFSGGVSNIFEEFYSYFMEGIKENTLNFLINKVKFEKSKLEDAGILGAVGLWI